MAPAYNPRTGLLYVPAPEACARFKRGPTVYREGLFYLGGEADVRPNEQREKVRAFDPATGRKVWSWRGQHPMGGLHPDDRGRPGVHRRAQRKLQRLPRAHRQRLWQYNTGNGIHSNAVTYSAGGTRYVAVPTGWGGWLEGFAPEMYGAPRGSTLFVFALPG